MTKIGTNFSDIIDGCIILLFVYISKIFGSDTCKKYAITWFYEMENSQVCPGMREWPFWNSKFVNSQISACSSRIHSHTWIPVYGISCDIIGAGKSSRVCRRNVTTGKNSSMWQTQLRKKKSSVILKLSFSVCLRRERNYLLSIVPTAIFRRMCPTY